MHHQLGPGRRYGMRQFSAIAADDSTAKKNGFVVNTIIAIQRQLHYFIQK